MVRFFAAAVPLSRGSAGFLRERKPRSGGLLLSWLFCKGVIGRIWRPCVC